MEYRQREATTHSLAGARAMEEREQGLRAGPGAGPHCWRLRDGAGVVAASWPVMLDQALHTSPSR